MTIRDLNLPGQLSAPIANTSIGCICDATPRADLSAPFGQGDSAHWARICPIFKKGDRAFFSTKRPRRVSLGRIEWRVLWSISQHHGHVRQRQNHVGIPCFSRRSVSSDLSLTRSSNPWLIPLATRPLAHRSRIALPANTLSLETSPLTGGRHGATAHLGVCPVRRAPRITLRSSNFQPKVRPC